MFTEPLMVNRRWEAWLSFADGSQAIWRPPHCSELGWFAAFLEVRDRKFLDNLAQESMRFLHPRSANIWPSIFQLATAGDGRGIGALSATRRTAERCPDEPTVGAKNAVGVGRFPADAVAHDSS